MVKSGEGEQPIGLASLLNMRRYRGLDALQQIRQHLIKSCSDAAIRELLLPVPPPPLPHTTLCNYAMLPLGKPFVHMMRCRMM